MTQDEINLVLDALKFCHGGEPCGTAEAIAVVEKALAQPKQEPVAWISPKGHIHFDPYLDSVPLYTHPPQRTWVGLTDEEIEQLHTAWVLGGGFRQLCNAIEAKLRSKNGY